MTCKDCLHYDVCERCGKTVDFPVDDGVCLDFADRSRCKKANEPFVQTNADRIRAMSDEELAELLLDGCIGSTCSDQPHSDYGSVDCFKCRMDWLRQHVKDGEDE